MDKNVTVLRRHRVPRYFGLLDFISFRTIYKVEEVYPNLIELVKAGKYTRCYYDKYGNAHASCTFGDKIQKHRFPEDVAYNYVLVNDLGDVIPPEVVIHYCLQFGHRRKWGTSFEYRYDPVPRTGFKRGGYHSRRIHTLSEKRENDALAYDEDCLEYGITPRKKRCGYNLPSSWDARGRNQEKNWKRQRRTQWKKGGGVDSPSS